MGKKRIRRTWSDDEKRMICDQARLPGVSTAQVARRYAMNANLLFKWLRDPAYQVDISGEDRHVFLPVEISDGPPLELAAPAAPKVARPRLEREGHSIPAPTGRIEIITPSGFRVIAEGNFDGGALGRLLKALAS
ncbi:MAG: transposase [Rhodobacteraceae bacterium]|nr:transposase [Paracoccaceae bacterium]